MLWLTATKNCLRFSQLLSRHKCTIDYSKVPKIEEKDLVERFIRGSGPGGSATNKNSNCAFVKHIPTGVSVKCHESRSLDENRKRARQALINKLDELINKSDSVAAQKKRIEDKQKLARKQKRDKLRKLKLEWMNRENI
ncbi:mitochondrial translation release factor in rescue-like [Aethina tumida]|uniref:mitochondrial translation release factor in rescue-like n=1 Tax=Aethina tumida TaxID=116153 RepID=UPI0021496562|nr:mitochondrial translation release factor in rescue-like [Aethina tumida]